MGCEPTTFASLDCFTKATLYQAELPWHGHPQHRHCFISFPVLPSSLEIGCRSKSVQERHRKVRVTHPSRDECFLVADVLKRGELRFLQDHLLCRLATASKDAQPHVTPVIYALDGEDVIVVIDYGEKKLKNLRENPKVSLVVDDFRPNKGLVLQGTCAILERGKEYLRLRKLLYDRFEYYRKNPWGEGESPILRIVPSKSSSWGVR